MAIFKPSSIASRYHKMIPTGSLKTGIKWSMELRRATILFRRLGAGSFDLDQFNPFARDVPIQVDIERYRRELKFVKGRQGGINAPDVVKHSNFKANSGNQSLEDYVALIDIDAKGYNKGYEVIKLPFIPKELNYNPESSFVAIKPIGANNPRYQYTGAEDRLEFEIDWYAFDMDRRQVIENCRKIESLTKADAYKGNPHRVKLQWGTSNLLFDDHVFVVLSAPYRMTQFNKGYIQSNGVVKSTQMLPIQAYQKITLGRISSNNMSKIEVEYVADSLDRLGDVPEN